MTGSIDLINFMSWLLVGGLALICLIWFIVLRLDRAEREREREARGRSWRSRS